MSEELISSKYSANMESAQISEQTKALLICRAKMRDIYTTVSNVINKDYPYLFSIDDMFGGFSDKFNMFDEALTDVINHYVKETTLESNYTRIQATPEAVRGQPNNINMNEDRVLTIAKSALKQANIIRYKNEYEIIKVQKRYYFHYFSIGIHSFGRA